MNNSLQKKSFRIHKLPHRVAMGQDAAADVSRAIASLLKQKPTINMIFAAAPSQNEFLDALVCDNTIDFSRINAFHMDEYIGLSKQAPQRFGNYLYEHLFSRVPFAAVHYIDYSAQNPEAECERYATLLRENPPDIVCMGIGENGHIAFNDPHVACFHDDKLVKVVTLDEVCRQQQVNDGCFATLADVPQKAITLTIPALMSAAHHFCIVPSHNKAQAVYTTVYGPSAESCPASAIKMGADVTLYLDTDSGSHIFDTEAAQCSV